MKANFQPGIHPDADHAYGSRGQFLRATAHGPMDFHVVHFAVVARIEPPQQMLLVGVDLDMGDAQLTEAQRPGAVNQRLLGSLEVKFFKLIHGEAAHVSIITAWLCRSLSIPLRRFARSMHTPSTCKEFPATR